MIICVHVIAVHDPGWVMAILYSRLALSLRFAAIILPIHQCVLSLTSTFATVSLPLPYISLWGQIQAYMPWHYYPFPSKWTHFAHGMTSCQVVLLFPTQHYGVNNWQYSPPNIILKYHYSKARSIDCSFIQLSPWLHHSRAQTNRCTMHVTGNEDDDYHMYKAKLFHSSNKWNQIRSI